MGKKQVNGRFGLDIMFKSWKNNLIGGGSYDDNVEGDSVKTGQWIEISEGFRRISQTKYSGDYKNGRKVGKWNIDFITKDIYSNFNGGGFYDKEDSFKTGKWVELSDRFYNYSQVTYDGEYKNCKKIGRWIIKFEDEEIGGGYYDNQDSFKTGEWIELSDRFDFYSQVTYKGKYHKGKKIGKWDILWNFKGVNYELGGGQYDHQTDGLSSIKIGFWIEQSDQFDKWQSILNEGHYENGKKIGRWVEVKFQKIKKEVEFDYVN
ncbi:unnamed protein product (macronuclear) [Paramecium tetraurelia]|uniref:MORN repeat protein n=1 Tax=Paramecium tetraurelia TaxID=5888 RepID=A0BX64_PARTE|nr:uncharacterized protein GSPATT00032983001 [Paramecium tetraurelia]CAK63131.1 unnamed protein product [Paramecium tetraurelia]|eukprot:XP_001430529.1 hypothetical protein (macronuclear) [Paramecium tetraurelia strain d4-2]